MPDATTLPTRRQDKRRTRTPAPLGLSAARVAADVASLYPPGSTLARLARERLADVIRAQTTDPTETQETA